jgi:hypothetical protein
MTKQEWSRSWRPWARGTAIGFPLGVLPAGGSELPTFLSYNLEKRLASRKAKSEFGKGAIEGVAGPEAANNANAAGSLVPLTCAWNSNLSNSCGYACILSISSTFKPVLCFSASDQIWFGL